MRERTCDICGKVFIQQNRRGPAPRRCSDTCRREKARQVSKAYYRNHQKMGTRAVHLCQVCGATWSNIRAGGPSLYCGSTCARERNNAVARERYERVAPTIRQCDQCGSDFESTADDRIRFCPQHRGDARHRGDTAPRDCPWCGRTFEPTRAFTLYCSKEHSYAFRRWRAVGPLTSRVPKRRAPKAPKTLICPWCERPFTNKTGRQKFCTTECGIAHRQYSVSGPLVSDCPIVECGCCGDEFRSPYGRRRYCTEACSKARNKWPISPKKRLKVLTRDGFQCQLCGEMVDPLDLEFRTGSDGRTVIIAGPMYGSMDHIVSRDDGGGHEMWNLRTAHMKCNTDRRTGNPNEQLRWAI